MKTVYHYTYFCMLFFIFLVHCYNSTAQEICNNGKDDDGNGLIDLRDPACQCHFNVTDNLLLNGSFESYNHCPVAYTYDNDYKVADYWQYGSNTSESRILSQPKLHLRFNTRNAYHAACIAFRKATVLFR